MYFVFYYSEKIGKRKALQTKQKIWFDFDAKFRYGIVFYTIYANLHVCSIVLMFIDNEFLVQCYNENTNVFAANTGKQVYYKVLFCDIFSVDTKQVSIFGEIMQICMAFLHNNQIACIFI